MKKQRELFEEVKKRYPSYTYKKYGELLGLQTTRVFRLMNGTQMRASEYFQIKEVLESNSSELDGLIHYIEKNSLSISKSDCAEIVNELEGRIFLNKLGA